MTRFDTHVKILFSGLGAIIVASMIVWPVLADFSDNEWRFLKSITLQDRLRFQALVEMTPDLDVFTHALPGLGDLRVIEKNTFREVPYKLLVERGELRRESINVSLKDLRHAEDYTSFVVDITRTGVLHNEIEVRTRTQNFQRTVVVEGSEDGDTWSVLLDQGRIFDLTIPERSFATKDTRVRYPVNTGRYLRIKIFNDDEKPLEIGGAVVFFVQELKPKETEFPIKTVNQSDDLENRNSVVLVDLGTGGIPSNKLVLDIQQKNFYRKVFLEGSDDEENWQVLLKSKVIYSYDTPRFVGNQLLLGYSESTFRYLRVTVFNEDDEPLHLRGPRVFGFSRKLVFTVDPGDEYSLYYGNKLAEPPYYDIEELFPYMVTDKLPQTVLGPQVANPLYSTKLLPFTERYPWLLPSFIAFSALVIGLFLANLMRQVRKSLRPPDSKD